MFQPLRFSAAALAVALSFAAAPARAGIDSCGNIDVRGNAKCEVKVDAQCMAECTPPKLQAACAAKLEVNVLPNPFCVAAPVGKGKN